MSKENIVKFKKGDNSNKEKERDLEKDCFAMSGWEEGRL